MTAPLFFCLTSKQSFTIIYVNTRLLNGGFVLKDTKERILESALKLFATDGYEAVSVSMIAGELPKVRFTGTIKINAIFSAAF